MERKPGITFIAFVMGIYALNGLASTINLFEENNNLDIVFFLLSITTGIVASVVTVGLWKMKPWAYKYFIIFIISFIFTSVFNQEIEGFKNIHWSITALLIIANVLLVYYVSEYIKRNTCKL